MSLSRRKFLKVLGASASALPVTSALAPQFLLAEGPGSGKNFIGLYFAGGLDGIFAVPYYNSLLGVLNEIRGNLAVQPQDVLTLNSEVGLHENWAPFHGLVHQQQANLKIIEGVGFTPYTSRSHWDAAAWWASLAKEVSLGGESGYLGRAKELTSSKLPSFHVWGINTGQDTTLQPGGQNPAFAIGTLSGISYDDGPLDFSEAEAVRQTSRALLQVPIQDSAVGQKVRSSLSGVDPLVSRVRDVSAIQLFGDYGSAYIGQNFKDAVRLIIDNTNRDSSLNTAILIFYGGFDTHSHQLTYLPGLITDVAQALRGAADDLIHYNLWNNTVGVAYSEFGRTARCNDPLFGQQNGTDHGEGNKVLVFGGKVDGGGSNSVWGPLPTEQELRHERNCIIPQVHPSNIFARIFDWMGWESQQIITESYPPVQGLSLFRA